MALKNLPGQSVGYFAKRVSTNDGRALGTLTDSNHLRNILRSDKPARYDKEVINLYTQTGQKASDFTQMLYASDTFWSDDWTFSWKHGVAYQKPRILSNPATNPSTNVGRDGETFTLVFDKDDFGIGHVITAHLDYGQEMHVVADPVPQNAGFLYTLRLLSRDAQSDSVDSRWLEVGTEYEISGNIAGEFSERGNGLRGFGGTIELWDTISSGGLKEYSITSWADCSAYTRFGGSANENLDVIVYEQYAINEMGKPMKATGKKAWEPFIEKLIRDQYYYEQNTSMIWGKGGAGLTDGNKQEVIHQKLGVMPRIRSNGNYYGFNPGELNHNIIRDMFGDMFYGREAIQDRHVKLYANESAMQLWQKMNKDDLMMMGLTVIANDFIEGKGRDRMLNFGMSKFYSMETGIVELVHLAELDLAKNKIDQTAGKKTPPKFLVLDVSPKGNGLPQQNIREVRHKGMPSATWGHINGRRHYLGHAASQGMDSANMFPGYKFWMEDRNDVFIEDLTRTFLIEQNPQYI